MSVKAYEKVATERGTDPAFFKTQRLRSSLGVAVDALAVLVALVAPVPALGRSASRGGLSL